MANVVGSNNLLYIAARTLSGEAANLRIDLVDENNLHTTNAGRTVSVTGTEFTEYRIDYDGGYSDGGYGGTGCAADDAPCAVDGSRIVGLAIYPEADAGGFNDTIQIDYFSFGQPLDENAVAPGIVNYRDDLEDADEQFQGEPSGLTYSVDDGVLAIAGDGSAPAYQTIVYELRDEDGGATLADVLNSENLLYLRARTASGAAADLRIDLIDNDNFHTTLASLAARIEGDGYETYTLDYTGGYQDGGYGGTSCTADTQPCAVDGQRIARLAFYPNPAAGGFNDTIFVDWLSFGSELAVSLKQPKTVTGISLYPNPTADEFTLRYHLPRAATLRFVLTDGLGRTVVTRRREGLVSGDHTETFIVGGTPPGVYYLRVLDASGAISASLPVVIR